MKTIRVMYKGRRKHLRNNQDATIEERFAGYGYKLIPEGSGFRVWKESANLYGAFWTVTVALNILGTFVEGRRQFAKYRAVPEGGRMHETPLKYESRGYYDYAVSALVKQAGG